MKILITGATGFVGKAIVERLGSAEKLDAEKLEGAEKPSAAVLELYTCGKRESSDLPNYRAVDISSPESVAALGREIGNIDCVIHSAGLAHQFSGAKEPDAFERINVEGTRSIARMAAAAGCQRFILISSISVYGEDKPNPCGEHVECRPKGDYAVSKFRAESVAEEICREQNIDLVILRLATVYGEGDVGNVLRLIKLIDAGRFFWAGKGNNSKSLIHNSDAARACALALESELPGVHIYNVTDSPHTMRQIVETIAENLGRKISRLSIPPDLFETTLKFAGLIPVVGGRARSLAGTLKKWQSNDVLSGEKLGRELGFYPEVSLPEGIEREVRWYEKNKGR